MSEEDDLSSADVERIDAINRRHPVVIRNAIRLPAFAAMMFAPGPRPIEDFRRRPKARKVSPAKLAKRKKQAAQKRARKIERRSRP